MRRKLALIFAIAVLAVISLSLVTALNDTSDSLTADDGGDVSVSMEKAALSDESKDIQKNDDKDTLSEGGLTVEKKWDDADNAAGKRSSSVKVNILQNGDILETWELNEANGWKLTADLLIDADSTYSVEETDVPDGYTCKVTGNARDGFVVTNTLKDTPKNDTDKNSTNSTPRKDPEKKNPVKKDTKVVKKTTTKTEPVKKQAKKNAKKQKDKNKTGNPVLLGMLALSAAGIAVTLRRKE